MPDTPLTEERLRELEEGAMRILRHIDTWRRTKDPIERGDRLACAVMDAEVLAREDLPELIAEVRRAREERDLLLDSVDLLMGFGGLACIDQPEGQERCHECSRCYVAAVFTKVKGPSHV